MVLCVLFSLRPRQNTCIMSHTSLSAPLPLDGHLTPLVHGFLRSVAFLFETGALSSLWRQLESMRATALAAGGDGPNAT